MVVIGGGVAGLTAALYADGCSVTLIGKSSFACGGSSVLAQGGVAVALGAVVALAEPYRVARLMSFTDPWADQYGAGYQLTQSLIAFVIGKSVV